LALAKSNFDFISCVAPDGIPCPFFLPSLSLLGFQLQLFNSISVNCVFGAKFFPHTHTHQYNGKAESPEALKIRRQLDKVNSLMGKKCQV